MHPAQRSTPRRKRKEARPREILEAGLEQFLARGYAATRLEDVAALACVTKGTLYLYFENKEQLFLSVIEHNAVCQLDSALALADTHHGSVESRIRTLLTILWESVFSTSTGKLFKIIVAESANFPTIVSLYADSVIKPLEAVLADMVNCGRSSGEFRALDAAVVSRAMLDNLLMMALRQRTFDGGNDAEDLTEVINTVLNVWLHGLRSRAAQSD